MRDDAVDVRDVDSSPNPIALKAWRGRVDAAQAVLNAQPPAHEKKARRVLAEAASALAAAIERLDRSVAQGQQAAAQAQAERRRYESLFEDLPIAVITTQRWGDIVDLNPVAATLLNLSARHAAAKSLLLFFDPRTEWMDVCRTLAISDAPLVRAVTVRPRDRAPQRLIAQVRLVEDNLARWFLLPATE